MVSKIRGWYNSSQEGLFMARLVSLLSLRICSHRRVSSATCALLFTRHTDSGWECVVQASSARELWIDSIVVMGASFFNVLQYCSWLRSKPPSLSVHSRVRKKLKLSFSRLLHSKRFKVSKRASNYGISSLSSSSTQFSVRPMSLPLFIFK